MKDEDNKWSKWDSGEGPSDGDIPVQLQPLFGLARQLNELAGLAHRDILYVEMMLVGPPDTKQAKPNGGDVVKEQDHSFKGGFQGLLMAIKHHLECIQETIKRLS